MWTNTIALLQNRIYSHIHASVRPSHRSIQVSCWDLSKKPNQTLQILFTLLYKLWGHADLIYNCLCMHACMQGASYSGVTSCCPNSYFSRLGQFTIHEMLNFQDGKRDYNSVLSLKNVSQTIYRHSHNMFAIPSIWKWWHYYTYELRPCCYAVDLYIKTHYSHLVQSQHGSKSHFATACCNHCYIRNDFLLLATIA